jgi:signal recognition particle subunit SRP54
MAQIMTSMAGKGMKDRMKMVRELQSGMMNNANGLSRQKVGTGKRLSNAERAKLKKQRDKEMRKRKREQRRGPN